MPVAAAKSKSKTAAKSRSTPTQPIEPLLSGYMQEICASLSIEYSPKQATVVVKSLATRIKDLEAKTYPACTRNHEAPGSLTNPHYLTQLGATANPPQDVLDTVAVGDAFKTKEDGDKTLFIAQLVLADDGGAVIVAHEADKRDGLPTCLSFRPPVVTEPTAPPADGELAFSTGSLSQKPIEPLNFSTVQRCECKQCECRVPPAHILTYAADDAAAAGLGLLPGHQLLIAYCGHCRIAQRAERVKSLGIWVVSKYFDAIDRGPALAEIQETVDRAKRRLPSTDELGFESDSPSEPRAIRIDRGRDYDPSSLVFPTPPESAWQPAPDETADEQQRQLHETDR